MINFFKEDSFSHQGQRDNNEDCVYPNAEVDLKLENLFLVCDGVGGLNKGEQASDLCCTQFSSYFLKNKVEVSNKGTIDNAVKFVEKVFDSNIVNDPSLDGMASTVTLLHFHKNGATVAHMGDSRVYQFRGGKVIFKTKDHSVVQDLLDQELITPEEAENHPEGNRITRAMRGASIKSYPADTVVLTEIKEGDIFFMCTDGVLESFNDKELEVVFSEDQEIDTYNAKIVRKCVSNSRDNYSAFTIKVDQKYIDFLKDNTQELSDVEDKTSADKIVQDSKSIESDIESSNLENEKVETDTKGSESLKSSESSVNKLVIEEVSNNTGSPLAKIEKENELIKEDIKATSITNTEVSSKKDKPEDAEKVKLENTVTNIPDTLKQSVEEDVNIEASSRKENNNNARNKNIGIAILGLLIGILVYFLFTNYNSNDESNDSNKQDNVSDKLW